MDLLSATLAGQRAEGAFVLRSDLVAPWSLRLEDRAPLSVVVAVRGCAVLIVDGEPPLALAPGDTALVRGCVDYEMADRPGTAPQALIGPGQVCSKPDGSPLSDFRDLGVRAWGNVPDGVEPETVLLTGSYGEQGRTGQRLLEHLEPAVVVRREEAPTAVAAVVGLLVAELGGTEPAQDVVLDRLVDLLAASLLRHWLTQSEQRPAWHVAWDDPVVGGVLRRIHHEPERSWTIDALAREVGVSRATLARQFTRRLGEPVMGYLGRWRVELAGDLLATTDLTVEAVAARVGYGSAFSLSTAFSRHTGTSPTAHRRRHRRQAS